MWPYSLLNTLLFLLEYIVNQAFYDEVTLLKKKILRRFWWLKSLKIMENIVGLKIKKHNSKRNNINIKDCTKNLCFVSI